MTLLEYGDLLAECRRTSEAETVYRKALDHDDTDAHRALASLLVETGRPDEAEGQLKLAIRHGDQDAVRDLADLYERLGRDREARELRSRDRLDRG